MNKSVKKGFTLLEMTVVCAIFTVFILYVFDTIVSVTRVSMSESIQLDLDGNANYALTKISSLLRSAVLPIRTSSASDNPLNAEINKSFRTNASSTEQMLADGANFIPFCQFVDGDGSGDCVDANKIPYLGIVRKGSGGNSQDGGVVHVVGGTYNDMVLNGGINEGLASVNWAGQKNTMQTTAPGNLALSSGNGGFAIIRFAPYCGPIASNEGNTSPVQVSLSDLSDVLPDLSDENVDMSQQYAVGTLEVYYPQASWQDPAGGSGSLAAATEPFQFANNMILVPVDGANGGGSDTNQSFVQPIFTLVYVDDDGAVLPADGTNYNAIRVQLSMVNVQDSAFFRPDAHVKYRTGRWNPVSYQKYETIIHLRSLSL